MKLLLILLILASCGKNELDDLIRINTEKDPRKTLTTDETFIKYIELFRQDHITFTGYNINLSKIPINFGTIKKGYLGVCFYYGKNGRWGEVKIDKSLWENLNEKEKELLINHELGHCALDRRHNDDTHENVPISLMNTYHIGNNYGKYTKAYLIELFTKNTDIIKAEISEVTQ